MSGIRVFVSVGRTSTPQQEQFVSAIEAHMLANGLMPQSLGRNYWSSQQPLRAIDELMSQCSGVAIVGFERLHVVQGIERRGSQSARPVTELGVPTVWNQIEAAMAYIRGLPLLVLVQEGLHAEGLLEPGYDWYVKRLPLAGQVNSDPEFCGIFEDWRVRVEGHRGSVKATARKAASETGTSPTDEARVDPGPIAVRKPLRVLLETRFSDEELQALCFDLSVDYENLKGTTKSAKAMALIGYFERMHRLGELLRAVKDLRPGEL